jgi:hypothetical protein
MKNSKAPLFFAGLLLASLLAPAAAADPANESRIASELTAVQGDCRGLAQNHLAAIERVPSPRSKSRLESKEPMEDYLAEVEQAEQAFLARHDGRIRDISERLLQLESDLLTLPPERLSKVSMGSLTELCRLATTPAGAGGAERLRIGIASSFRPVHQLGASGQRMAPAAGGPRQKGAEAEQKEREPAPVPLSSEEYRQKKERWEARLKEQEARELAELRLRQQELDRQLALEAQMSQAPQEPPMEAKVSLREGFELPARRSLTPEQLELKPKVETWHQTYSLAVNPFKSALSQVLSTPATRVVARRDACRILYGSAEALIKTKGLAAPDPAVAAPAAAMAVKFRQAANSCLEGKAEEAASGMREAEQELGKLAAALEVYGLKP